MNRVLVGVIRLYRLTISPDHSVLGRLAFPGGACRYQETCSQYAERAVVEHGAWRGLVLAAQRVWSCR